MPHESKLTRPIIEYGLKRHNDADNPERRFICMNCIIPGTIVQMRDDIYVVHGPNPQGFELTGDWLHRAERQGEQVVRLAASLQLTKGLPWLYILRTGFVGMGGKGMEENAQQIIFKMRSALQSIDGCADAEFVDSGQSVMIPSLQSVAASQRTGVLLPI